VRRICVIISSLHTITLCGDYVEMAEGLTERNGDLGAGTTILYPRYICIRDVVSDLALHNFWS
jgi:hypothetical protein